MNTELPIITAKRKSTSRNIAKNKAVRKKVKSKRHGFVFSICGVHGVGKTTVCNILEKDFADNPNIRFYPERLQKDTPFPFGSKDKQIAFRSELHYSQQMILRNGFVKDFVENNRESVAILDRSPICTLVYSRGLELPEKDYNLIADTVNAVDWVEDQIIYLEADPNVIMNRIITRGSLDPERLKWNEQDMLHLKKIINQYEKIFQEMHVAEKNRLERIKTDNLLPEQVVDEVIKIIERKTGLSLKRTMKMPKNQKKLTDWFN